MSVLGRSSAHGHSLAGAMAYLALWERQRSQPVPGSVVVRASSVVTAATRRGDAGNVGSPTIEEGHSVWGEHR
jgi:hypothetical protein